MNNMKLNIKIIIIVLLIIAVYLNRAYAHIYSNLNSLSAPIEKNYMTKQTFSAKSKTLNYVALGDSLTSGVGASSVDFSLPALLAEKISTGRAVPIKVINLAVPGATSFDLLAQQVANIGQYNPDIITVFIGTNDVHNFVPLDKFKDNLTSAINSIKQATKAQIYLINIPYIGEKEAILPPYDLFFDMKIKEYNGVIANAAKNSNVRLIDLYSSSKQLQNASDDMYSSDHFHPSDKGYQLWANLIYDGLK